MEWRKIPNYKYYLISEYGDIKSLDRNISDSIGRNYLKKGSDLKHSKNKKGYLKIALHENGTYKNYKIHQLAAMAFLNHTPCGMKKIVDHIDENILNNHYTNLRITTNRSNLSRNKKGTSLLVGVSKTKKRYAAQIQINGINLYLKSYPTEILASNMYQKALNNKHLFNGNVKEFKEFLYGYN